MTNEQQNIFNLFQLSDEVGAKKREEEAKAKAEREAEAAAKAEIAKTEREAKLAEIRANKNETDEKGTSSNSNTKAKPEAPKFTPNENTDIRFYGESLEITSYFSAEELAEGQLIKKSNSDETERKPLTEELLRQRMEKDFPELVKEYTEITFIAEKNIIVPMIKAKKKGCTEMEVLSNDSTFAFPQIPFTILQEFISLAKLYAEEDLEVHADVYYRTETKTYFLDIPKQTVNTLWVEVTEDAHSIARRVLDAVKVLEIHSHHKILAFPSSQDNASERVPGMHYAIIGNMNNFFPDVYLRQFISEEKGHVLKSFHDLFECPFQLLPPFDTKSIEVSAK